MKYNRNQNSYEELQTIVEAQLKTIEELRTKLYKFKVLALEEELFNEVMKKVSKCGEVPTEFTLDQNEIYSLEGATEEQLSKVLKWLKENDRGWEETNNLEYTCALIYSSKKWSNYYGNTTKFIKDLF